MPFSIINLHKPLIELQNKFSTKMPTTDKTLNGLSNLVKLLPTTTLMVFQTLNPSFSNKGKCLTSNRYLTAILLIVCSLFCAFTSITDTFIASNDKLYYGFATFSGFRAINAGPEDGELLKNENLKKLRLRISDAVHVVFTVVVFLVLGFSDGYVQSCFFVNAGDDGRQLLTNLPLGFGVLASVVFMLMPNTRRGIGYSDGNTKSQPEVAPTHGQDQSREHHV